MSCKRPNNFKRQNIFYLKKKDFKAKIKEEASHGTFNYDPLK